MKDLPVTSLTFIFFASCCSSERLLDQTLIVPTYDGEHCRHDLQLHVSNRSFNLLSGYGCCSGLGVALQPITYLERIQIQSREVDGVLFLQLL